MALDEFYNHGVMMVIYRVALLMMELELTDAISRYLQAGTPVRAYLPEEKYPPFIATLIWTAIWEYRGNDINRTYACNHCLFSP
jgi:hypothetical protein